MVVCDNCAKFALFPQTKLCINCPRIVHYKEQTICDFCSTVKNVCSVCAKPIKEKQSIREELSEQINKIHPFINVGCRHCGGR